MQDSEKDLEHHIINIIIFLDEVNNNNNINTNYELLRHQVSMTSSYNDHHYGTKIIHRPVNEQ